MSTSFRVVGFLLGLAAVFVAAIGVGRAVGPVGANDESPAHDAEHAGSSPGEASEHGDHSSGSDAKAHQVGGLETSSGGYTLELAGRRTTPGASVPISFRILGDDGKPVTRFDTVHDKRLHLIAVRRDQTGFQHVHPRLGGDGTWRVPLDLTAGTWRLITDFTATGGEPTTLGTDLQVSGDYQAAEPLPPKKTAMVDGYRVTLTGDLIAGHEAALTLRVTRGGKPVRDLEPYLGAYGHLVTLREGDLAYLHVHPTGSLKTAEPGPNVAFGTTVPSVGDFRMYFDFKHDGKVRTASFAVSTTTGSGSKASSDPEGGHDDSADSHDH